MKAIGNVIWFVISGFWLGIGFALAGLLCFVTIIGIPFGIQAFKLAGFAFWPFGRTVAPTQEGSDALQAVFNVIWLVLFGWGLFLAALSSALVLCLTIIGIPFALQAVKIGLLALWPFGRTVVPLGAFAAGAPADGVVYGAPTQ